MKDTPTISPAGDSAEVRASLVEALRLDLVGPWEGHRLEEEALHGKERPRGWYLTGFLVPKSIAESEKSDADEAEEPDEAPERQGIDDDSGEERRAAKKSYFPSSMGLSFLVPGGARVLHVRASWGEYLRQKSRGADGEEGDAWKRVPEAVDFVLSLQGSGSREMTQRLPGSRGLELFCVERALDDTALAGQLPAGTRTVSLFLVNAREVANDAEVFDQETIFQAELVVRSEQPFVPRPDLRSGTTRDAEARVAELHYADVPEYAVGHGVAAEWKVVDGACRELRTCWIPSAEVEKTETVKLTGVELAMEVLGQLVDGAAARAALAPLVTAYRAWIEAQRVQSQRLRPEQRATAEQLLHEATLAAARMERGIEALARDADALDAFRVANRAVAAALRQRQKRETPPRNVPPEWRAFQLAFLLLNLPELAQPEEAHRGVVDLLFFPTGGGKTEAYLGLAAFAMVLRRLRHPADEGRAGAGVCVVMRYTLRLLTLDQLGRAAGLVCALELEREKDVQRYGVWPFEIGLWVGKAATPNRMGSKGDDARDTARVKVRDYKRDSRRHSIPIPLESCPWCGEHFEPESFTLEPNDDEPKHLRIVCTSARCPFHGKRALPIVAVDEPLYRRLPAFVIATVDKFASLPWTAESGALLGGAERYDADGFYGAASPRQGRRLTTPLRSPELIIQDELHLISGPLGTMAGLYETAIEALCLQHTPSGALRPKIVASTATARRASEQVQALFGRAQTRVFPPPGPARRDSFFARVVPASEAPARLYLGVAAQGRNPKVVLRRVYLALMAAAEKAYHEHGGRENDGNPADPYMTALGYFNSLRELGGCRRILEEEVQSTLKMYGRRKRWSEKRGSFRDRERWNEVVELTSRIPTSKVAEYRDRLHLAAHEKDRVDCAIATNMISVGLDIPRLGLMVVLGQPKSHSEYIQATSRVGRSAEKPGLVVTLLNIGKPRDRSHYERFRHYHESFYRSVEAGSVTPFAARALDRGFAGAMVGFARHAQAALTPSQGAEAIEAQRAALEERLIATFRARLLDQPLDEEMREECLRSVQDRIVDLLDAWTKLVRAQSEVGAHLKYQRYEDGQGKPLLREMLEKVQDEDGPIAAKFRANRSLRDVEPEVNLFLDDLRSGGGVR